MIAERAGDLLHWFDAGSHGLAAPLVEELAGPDGGIVFPKLLKGFLEKVGPDSLEVVAQEIAKPEVLVGAETLATSEQQPAGFPEYRSTALTLHAAGLLRTDVVQSLVHVRSEERRVGK